MLNKEEAHRIYGKVLQWIRSWLSCKSQSVPINVEVSNWQCVTRGVPQGKALSTGFCIGSTVIHRLYINDLDPGMNSKISEFVDDTNVGILIRTNLAVSVG